MDVFTTILFVTPLFASKVCRTSLHFRNNKVSMEVFLMKKITKSVKDANPEIYGYPSPDLIEGNWIPYVDVDNDLRFIPCTYEFFKWYDNEKRKEELARDRESRCLVLSKRYKGLVRCMENCNNCPYHKDHREGHHLSLDQFQEDGYDIPAPEPVQEDERMIEVWQEVAKMCDQDQTILKLFNEGKTDAAIAEVVCLTRECVKKRRQRLIEELKKKFN